MDPLACDPDRRDRAAARARVVDGDARADRRRAGVVQGERRGAEARGGARGGAGAGAAGSGAAAPRGGRRARLDADDRRGRAAARDRREGAQPRAVPRRAAALCGPAARRGAVRRRPPRARRARPAPRGAAGEVRGAARRAVGSAGRRRGAAAREGAVGARGNRGAGGVRHPGDDPARRLPRRPDLRQGRQLPADGLGRRVRLAPVLLALGDARGRARLGRRRRRELGGHRAVPGRVPGAFAAYGTPAELARATELALRLGWVCRAINGDVPGDTDGPNVRLRMFLDGHP